MCENGGEGITFSSGSGPIFWLTCCFWQITHFLVVRLTLGLPWVIQILCLKVESKVSGLACNCLWTCSVIFATSVCPCGKII